MGFNSPVGTSDKDYVSTAIVNQINVDGTNVKVLPAGTPPTVVYRVGDGTVHEEGWDNVEGEQYLDFYISTGARGADGLKGEDGESAYSQAVAGGYGGTQEEFYTLLTEGTDTSIIAVNAANAALVSEINALASENATDVNLVATNSDVATTNANVLITNADVVTTNANVVLTNADVATTTANALASSNSATSASASAVAADISAQDASTSLANIGASEVNSANSATSAQLKAWEAEARKLTADSYATQDEDVFVTNYTSNGDGTFSTNPTSDYSSYHWSQKAQSVAGDTIDVLGDVDTTGRAVGTMDYLRWDGTNYVASGLPSTTAPTLSFTTPVGENSDGNVITITNFDSDAEYTFTTDVGTINYTQGSAIATFDAKNVTDDNDDIGVITCFATKAGELKSSVTSQAITVSYIPMVADSAVTFNFATDTENVQGFE